MKNRNIVKQDFKLVNAKYKLNTSEIKFIMNAIAQIDADDDEFTEYEIKVSDLEEKLQMAKNKHTRLKEFAKKIMSKPILIEQEDEDFTVFNWFSRIRYISKQAKFIVKIDDELKPYLLNLKNRFVKYNLKYILPLTSNYSIKIYQLLKEYEKLEKRKFKVEELQDFLQVPKSLKNYADFKRKVLKVAERELIKHCDIFFEFEEIKAGRKVDEILFRIKENKHIKEKEAIEDINYTKEFSRFKKQKFWLNGEIGTFINTSNENNKIALNFKMNQGNAKAIFETEEGAYNFLSSNRA
jgi:plasmid replication initiation protein